MTALRQPINEYCECDDHLPVAHIIQVNYGGPLAGAKTMWICEACWVWEQYNREEIDYPTATARSQAAVDAWKKGTLTMSAAPLDHDTLPAGFPSLEEYKSLTPLEQARHLKELNSPPYKWAQKRIANFYDISMSSFWAKVSLLELPKAKRRDLADGKLTEQNALAYLRAQRNGEQPSVKPTTTKRGELKRREVIRIAPAPGDADYVEPELPASRVITPSPAPDLIAEELAPMTVVQIGPDPAPLAEPEPVQELPAPRPTADLVPHWMDTFEADPDAIRPDAFSTYSRAMLALAQVQSLDEAMQRGSEALVALAACVHVGHVERPAADGLASNLAAALHITLPDLVTLATLNEQARHTAATEANAAYQRTLHRAQRRVEA